MTLDPAAPATCPVCDATLTPVHRPGDNTWRYPDHPNAVLPLEYQCVESRRTVTDHHRRAAARAEGEAA